MNAREFFGKYLGMGYPIPDPNAPVLPTMADLQKQIIDLGTALAFTIDAANILTVNQDQMAQKIATLEEELRILRLTNGA